MSLTVKQALWSIVLNEIAEMFRPYDEGIYEHLEDMREALPVGEKEYDEAKRKLDLYLRNMRAWL